MFIGDDEMSRKKVKRYIGVSSYSSKKFGTLWRVHFTYHENGITKTYDKRGFKSQEEAHDHYILVQYDLKTNGSIKKECTMTFKQVYDEFLEVGTSKYQINTIYNTKTIMKEASEIFNYPIRDIDFAMFQKLFNKREDKSLAMNKRLKRALNRVLEYALDVGYVETNPLKRVVVFGIDTHKDHDDFLEFEDFVKIITALEDKKSFRYDAYSVAVQIGYYTGMRVSEIFALEKNDIDFENDIIDINKKLVYHGLRKDEIHATHQMKSKASKSTIPLAFPLKESLIEWFDTNSHDKIICDENGDYLNPITVGNYVKQTAAKLGIDFHFHMLRHTFTTNLIDSDVSIKEAQELLRHSNYNVTMTIYTHTKEQHKKDEINRVFGTKCVKNVSKTHSDGLIN